MRRGKVHSVDGTLDLIKPLVDHYRSRFQLFWFRGDAAFAKPEIYEYCESKRVTYFIRLPQNETLKEIIRDDFRRPAGRWPRSGVKVRIFDFPYQARRRISYHGRCWWVHVASAFPLNHHCQAVFGHG